MPRPRPRFAVGLEGGLNPVDVPDRLLFALQTWAAVTDGTDWGYGAGGAVMIPGRVARRVLAGEELGDVVDRLVGEPTRGTRGAWGVLTRDLVGALWRMNRQQFSAIGCAMAKPPKFVTVQDKREDPRMAVEVIDKALGAGIPLKKDEVYERIGFGPAGKLAWMFVAGLFIGFGTRLAGGCTSGHGISGALQLSVGSWIALICFFLGGIAIAMPMYRI